MDSSIDEENSSETNDNPHVSIEIDQSNKNNMVSTQQSDLINETDQKNDQHENLIFELMKTILIMENLFKAVVFFCVGMLGFFSFCDKKTLYKANILSFYKKHDSL